ASMVHALSEIERQHLESLGVTSPVGVVPSGVDLKQIDTAIAKEGAGRTSKFDHLAPFVLYVGRLASKKGLEAIVEAFSNVSKHHPRLRLVIAGLDERGNWERVKELARRRGVLER